MNEGRHTMMRTTDDRPSVGSGSTGAWQGTPADRREEFIQHLYDTHGTLLLRFATRLLGGDLHHAEDILQEAFVRAWKHESRLSKENNNDARPWLYTVVKNLIIDYHRSQRSTAHSHIALCTLDGWVTDSSEQVLTSQIVTEAVAKLSERHREIITLVYVLGYSINQAAAHLGIPPGTVKSRSFYALRALEGELRARGVTH